MTLAHINSFDTDNPTKLGRQLSDFEDRVSNELNSVRVASAPVPKATSFLATSLGAIVALMPDQQLAIDTSLLSASAILPPLDSRNYGRVFRIIKRASANSIVFSCQDTSVLCNGTTFPTVTAIGITIFYCDVGGYYK